MTMTPCTDLSEFDDLIPRRTRMHKITIPQTITLSYDGTQSQFVHNCDRLAIAEFGQGLDSLDAGDATGLITQLLELGHDEDDPIRFADGTTIYISRSTDLYKHEGNW